MSGASLNGVNLDAVGAVADRFRADPDLGRQPFVANVRWLGGYQTESHLGGVAPVHGDEPVELAGAGTGPSPEDMLLSAVGQCLIVGIAGTASARGIGIESLEVDVGGTVNLTAAYGIEAGNPGFQSISVVVHLVSSTPKEVLEELVAHALDLAPIPNTIRHPVPVDVRLA
jgi:uncharacterized OsmC-like protein